MPNLIYPKLSYAIVGAAMEVHNKLGSGFLENVYQNALAHELKLKSITFEQYTKLKVRYKSIIVGEYEADFVIEGKIILEIKAISTFHQKHVAQALNYLTATGYELALLMNFGESSFKHKRIVNSKQIRSNSQN